MYQLNVAAARQADNVGSYLNEMGAYKGVIVSAYEKVSKTKGTKGVCIVFESNGQKARFDMWVRRADGTDLPDFGKLMSLMTCAKVKSLAPKSGIVKIYDRDANAEADHQVNVLPELVGKSVSIAFETEDYQYNGEVKTKLIPKHFASDDGFTAGEIFDKKTTATQFEKLLGYLRHRPLRHTQLQAQQQQKPAASFNDMDDDIPF
jgi:hypothetical protein